MLKTPSSAFDAANLLPSGSSLADNLELLSDFVALSDYSLGILGNAAPTSLSTPVGADDGWPASWALSSDFDVPDLRTLESLPTNSRASLGATGAGWATGDTSWSSPEQSIELNIDATTQFTSWNTRAAYAATENLFMSVAASPTHELAPQGSSSLGSDASSGGPAPAACCCGLCLLTSDAPPNDSYDGEGSILDDFVTSGGKWGPSGTFGTTGGTVTWSIAGAGWSNTTGVEFFSGTTVSLSSFLSFDFTSILTQAFASWSAVANVNFVQVADGGGNLGTGTDAFIRIGGGFIDGRPAGSSVLARAFFPGSAGNAQNFAYSGDMIFDSAEGTFWTSSSFLAVAAHEIGHSLGLRHTSVSGSLMEPFYNPSITAPQADDIAGIRSIYGTAVSAAGSISINDVTIIEGNAGTQIATFTVARSGGTAAFAVNFSTTNNTAVAGSDYVATSGTLSFGSGVNTQTVSVTINGDTAIESTETFFINLSGATNGATIADGQGVGTINNDDSAVPIAGSVSIGDVTITEGNSGTQVATFTVMRSGGTAAFAVNFATANNSAVAGSDYVATSGTLSFGSVNTQTISVTINGDNTIESTETFFLNLSGATNGATITDGQGIGTIVNDDNPTSGDDYADSLTDTTAPFGSVSVGGTATGNLETTGDRDWFRVTLSAGTSVTIELLGIDTNSGTLADPFVYFYNAAGQLLLQDDDSGFGYNSQLAFTLGASGIYYIGAGSFADGYTGTYMVRVTPQSGDDYADSITDTTAPFGQLSVGSSATGNLEVLGDRDWFRVTLTAGVQFTFDLQGSDTGSGTLADPYLYLYDGSGNFIIQDDDTGTGFNSQLVYTPGTSGTYYLAASGFADSFAGTYTLGTTAPTGSVSVSDVAITEGNAGTQIATFTVTRSGGAAPFAVNFSTANGTAAAGSDYVAVSGTLNFGSGVNTQTISVTINGDTAVEPNETFFVNLSGATNGASIADGQGLGTIVNDDVDDYAGNTTTTGNIATGGAITGNLESIGDRDWFRITLTSETAVTIDLRGVETSGGTLGNPYLRLYNAAGTLLAEDDDFGAGVNGRLVFSPSSTGTYYIGAGASNDAGVGTYTVNVASTFTAGHDTVALNVAGAVWRTLAGNDSITGTSGADTVYGDAGNDLVDGGAGADTAGFSVARSAVTLIALGSTTAVLNPATHETDRVTATETLQFTNVSVSTNSVPQFAAFDYLASYNDLIQAFGANEAAGFEHYIANGFFEGRAADAFNGIEYLASYDDLIQAFGADEAAAAQHFVATGFGQGRSRDAFDGFQYLASYGDLIQAFGANETAAAQHFVGTGFGEGRSRDAFDGFQYLAAYDDLIQAIGPNEASAAQHFVANGFGEGRSRDAFDGFQYLATYDDLIQAFGANETAGAQHFVANGFAEGRSRDAFDGFQYLASYDDLIQTIGANETAAAQHFVASGFAQGRSRDAFDGLQYIASYGDLIEAFGANETAAAQHFVANGFAEGRSRDDFNASQYLANYADLQAAFGTDEHAATFHFITNGYFEGRTDDLL